MTRPIPFALVAATLTACGPPTDQQEAFLESYHERVPDARYDFPPRGPGGGDYYYKPGR